MTNLDRFLGDLFPTWKPFRYAGWLIGYRAYLGRDGHTRMLYVGRRYARRRA